MSNSQDVAVEVAVMLNREGYGEIKNINDFIRVIKEGMNQTVLSNGHDPRDVELTVGGTLIHLVYKESAWQAEATDEEIEKEAAALQAAGLTGLEDLEEDDEPIDWSDSDDEDADVDEDDDSTIELYPNEEDKEERYERLNRDAEKLRDHN